MSLEGDNYYKNSTRDFVKSSTNYEFLKRLCASKQQNMKATEKINSSIHKQV